MPERYYSLREVNRVALAFLGLLLPFLSMAETGNDLVEQGDLKKSHGDFQGAVLDYTQALTQNPKDVRAYLGRGSVRNLQGNFDGAIADETAAIAIAPQNAIAFSNRGNARAAKGDLSGAIADYTQAIALDPHHVRALLNRGNIENLEKNYSAAIGDYNAVIALEPKNALAFYNRAGARRAIAEMRGALGDYSEAIALNPVDVRAYLNRAVLEMAQRDWDGATADLQKCTRLISVDKQAYPQIYLWVVGAQRGEEAQATQELLRYLKSHSNIFEETWAWQIENFLAGSSDEAHFLSQAALFETKKDRGQRAQADYYIGLKRAMAGDKAGAAKFLNKCVASGNLAVHEVILAREELKFSGENK